MATFSVTIAEGYTDAQLIAMLTTWAASLNGSLTVGDNFDGTFTAGVANIADAADTKGFTMTGNITMPSGGTVDGVDISSLKDTVDGLQTTVTNEVYKSDNFVIASGTILSGQSILDKLKAVDGTVNDSDWTIKYLISINDVNAAEGGNNGTGIRRFTYTMNSWVVTASGIDEDAENPLTPSKILMYYMAFATKD